MRRRTREEEELEENGAYEQEEITLSKTDQRITAELMAFLEDEMTVDFKRISLLVRNGTAYIQGSVDTADQRELCENLLRDRPGIADIQSALQVQNMYAFDDGD